VISLRQSVRDYWRSQKNIPWATPSLQIASLLKYYYSKWHLKSSLFLVWIWLVVCKPFSWTFPWNRTFKFVYILVLRLSFCFYSSCVVNRAEESSIGDVSIPVLDSSSGENIPIRWLYISRHENYFSFSLAPKTVDAAPKIFNDQNFVFSEHSILIMFCSLSSVLLYTSKKDKKRGPSFTLAWCILQVRISNIFTKHLACCKGREKHISFWLYLIGFYFTV